MTSTYVELVFFSVHNYGIVRKIRWNKWRLTGYRRLIHDDGRIIFLYNETKIEHIWKTFRRQNESYLLPFKTSKLRISLKHG